MSEYKLGKLSARVEIDQKQLPRFGPEDSVTGNVILTYHHYVPTVFKSKVAGTANLFGPIKIHVFLLGKIKITVRRDREIPTSHGLELFKGSFPVADSTFHAEAGGEYRFPFVAYFPGDTVNYEEDASLDDLPPSLSLHFSDYPDIVDVSVRYQLGCTVIMPGIDIKIQVPEGHYLAPVKYERPRPPLSFVESKRSSFKHYAKLQNEYLLPEQERPHGFKQKAKAVFVSNQYPVLGLDIWLTHPWCMYPGQKISLEVLIRKNDSHTTAPGVPEVALSYVRANLLARTEVDTSRRLMGSSRCTDTRRVVQSLDCETRLPAVLSKQNEYAMYLDMNSLLAHPSSFAHHKLGRSYSLRFNLRFEVAKKVVKMERYCDVVLVPPPSQAWRYDLPPPVEAGPSRTADEERDLPPPTYQEAQAAAGPSKSGA